MYFLSPFFCICLHQREYCFSVHGDTSVTAALTLMAVGVELVVVLVLVVVVIVVVLVIVVVVAVVVVVVVYGSSSSSSSGVVSSSSGSKIGISNDGNCIREDDC